MSWTRRQLTSFKIERMMKQIGLLCAHSRDPLERHNDVKDDQRSIGIRLRSSSLRHFFLDS